MSEEKAMYEVEANEDRTLEDAVRAFIEQVEKIEYRDFYGVNVKMNLAFLELKRITSRIKQN